MTTTPGTPGTPEREALAAAIDRLIADGFQRQEDWLVKNEGEEFEEQIHVDTITLIATPPAAGVPQALKFRTTNESPTEPGKFVTTLVHYGQTLPLNPTLYLAARAPQTAPAPQPEAATVLREALDMLGEQELKDVFGYEWFGRARHAAARPSVESVERDAARWVPVGERLPDDDCRALCATWVHPLTGEKRIEICSFRRGTGLFDDGSERPTHWMPLPPPPAALAQAGDKEQQP